MRKRSHKKKRDSKDGFTLVEVMLALAITGLMLVGLIGGSYTSIARQRYTDALNGLAEYFSRVYGEVLSPESLGQGNSDSAFNNNLAIIGKVLVIGYEYADSEDDSRSIFSATLVGDADISQAGGQSFLDELTSLAEQTDPTTSATKLQLFCGDEGRSFPSTVAKYTPLWQTKLFNISDIDDGRPFRGTIIIARTPTSNAIHTAFASDETYNLRDECNPDNKAASTQFVEGLRNDIGGDRVNYTLNRKVEICLESDDSPIARQVNIAADGGNASAISILSEGESRCH